MNKQLGATLRNGVLLCTFLLGFPARADIVFPARLQLTETAPGSYEVVFILPVINGKILKAQPVLPESCMAVSQATVQVDGYQKKTRWEIRCENTSLHGQQIGIEGLLGSPIDIILVIRTLDGRSYRTTLSPNESYYEVPPPPGLPDYLTQGTLAGARNLLMQWGLGLMLLSCLLRIPAVRFRDMLGIAILGVSLGHFLSAQELLLEPSWAGAVAALLGSLALLLPTGLGLQIARSGRTPLALLGICGVLIGGGFPLAEIQTGYTAGEFAIQGGFTLVGISLGVLLLALLARQFLAVLSLTGTNYRLPLVKGLAGLALGLLIWKLSLFWNFPSMLPPIPAALLGSTLALALWAAYLPRGQRRNVAAWVLPASLLGYLWGLWGIPVPYSGAVLLAAITLFLLAIRFGGALSPGVQKGIFILGGLAAGNLLFFVADDTLSYPNARSAFFGLLLALIAFLWTEVSGWISPDGGQKGYFRFASSLLLVFVLLLGTLSFQDAFPAHFVPSISEGKIPVPYLTLGCLLLGILLWPRYRKIHQKMEIRRKAPVASLTLLAAAVLFLPVYAEVRNPWYRFDLMDKGSLQALLERKLWNTYAAFNMADEEALFERLAENLDEGLLDHIYLDSRRRLTMGLREGSEVTVKEVALEPLGTPEPGTTGGVPLKYPATWSVTAQVKHLKHIHYRKNQYTGTIALKPMESGWKISEIILTSEDRKVIAPGSL